MNDQMKLAGGVVLPAHEQHLQEWMNHPKNKQFSADGKLVYQGKKQDAVLPYIKQFRTMVDVGAHCGLWSMHVGSRFHNIEAFEPVPLHRQCYELNVLSGWVRLREVNDHPVYSRFMQEGTGRTVGLHACALGQEDGEAVIATTNHSSGDSFVLQNPTEFPDMFCRAPMKRLDDVGLTDVDFMKLDCEGFEQHALRGGEETLLRCKPCVIVEQKPGRALKYGLEEHGAVTYLQSLGAVLRREMSGDFILSWD